MNTPRFTDRAIVEAALHHDALIPPMAPASIGQGATADLRAAMARFSSGSDHATRRRAAECALEPLAEIEVRVMAERATRHRLDTSSIEVLSHVGFVVPTEVLGEALGIAQDDLPDLVSEVCSVVEVIGRGNSATAATDAATMCLRRRFADHPGGADANISLLYQNHDATAALLASKLVAREFGTDRRAALAETVRFVSTDVEVDRHSLSAGTVVELSLDDAAIEFGAGTHRCPGERLAHEITDGIVDALHGWNLDVAEMQTDAMGRPTFLPIFRTP